MSTRVYVLRTPAAGETRPATPRYPDTRDQLLTAAEIRELGMASAEAWAKYVDECAAEGTPVQAMARAAKITLKTAQDQFRHSHVKQATNGRASGLRQLTRADFRTVRAHFLHLAGMDEAAFALLLRTGDTPKGEPVENVQQSARAVLGIMQKVEAHFAAQGAEAPVRAAAWFQQIVGWKERKAQLGWKSWDSRAQWNLYFTIKNRLAAMEGAGKTENRNKGQRAASRSRKASAATADPAPRAPSAPSPPATARGFTVEMDLGLR